VLLADGWHEVDRSVVPGFQVRFGYDFSGTVDGDEESSSRVGDHYFILTERGGRTEDVVIFGPMSSVLAFRYLDT